jgi:hypothetical protein
MKGGNNMVDLLKRSNLLEGLSELKRQYLDIDPIYVTVGPLVDLYAKFEVLAQKGFDYEMRTEIAYPCQNYQMALIKLIQLKAGEISVHSYNLYL